MGKDDFGPISQYNSLTDPNLQGYYSKSIIRSHLRQIGLINKKGEIIPEEVWRRKANTKEKMEQASRLIANKIVQQAIEIKNLERAEIRRKLEEVAKKELVRRVRGQSVQNRQLPLLWSNKPNSGDRSESAGLFKKESRSDDEFGEIRLEDDFEDSQRLFGPPKPRKLKPLSKNRSKKRATRFTRTFSAYPRMPQPEPTILTMIYYGKNIKIPFDYEIFEPKDEISIYQQHCGGENLLVYQGLHQDGDKFSFKSRRHKEYPFSLTIYVNGTYDCRISTCCEYRHKLNVRIGGKTGRFGFTNVIGDHPCVKCLLEKSNEEKKKTQAKREQEENFDDINPILDPKQTNENDQLDKNKEIPIKHTEDDEYGNDFENSYNSDLDDGALKKEYAWTVIVHTDSKTIIDNLNDRESSIKFKLIGEKGSSELIHLENMNKKNFLSGKKEKFSLVTDNNIGVPTHIILNFKDDNVFDWVVNMIELIDEENSKIYSFTFNDRIKKNHDIKIAVDEDKYAQKKWLIRVFTSDLPNSSKFEGTDSKVYLSLIGDNNQETDKIWLSKKLSKTKNRDLFEKGNIDEFLINTNLNLNRLESIRIGHDNSGIAPGWHLQKIEVIDQRTWAHYYFECDRWFSKDEDDGLIERIIKAWKGDSSSRNSKLEIKVRHLDDPDSDAELPPISNSTMREKEKVLSPIKSNRKSNTPQLISNSNQSLIKQQKSKTPEQLSSKPESKLSRPTSKASRNELDSKSLRLSANDLIHEINKQRESQLTNRSNSSKSSSIVIDSDDQSKKKIEASINKNLDNKSENFDESSDDFNDVSLESKTKITKRTESRQSKTISIKSEEKTRRLSGAEVEKIIANEVISQTARSTDSKLSNNTANKVKSSAKSSSSGSSENSDTSSLETDSDSSEESFMEVLNKSKSPNKDSINQKEDHLNVEIIRKDTPNKLPASSSTDNLKLDEMKISNTSKKLANNEEGYLRADSKLSKNSTSSKKSNRLEIKSPIKSNEIIKNQQNSRKSSLFESSSDLDDSSLFEKEKETENKTPNKDPINNSKRSSMSSITKSINKNEDSSISSDDSKSQSSTPRKEIKESEKKTPSPKILTPINKENSNAKILSPTKDEKIEDINKSEISTNHPKKDKSSVSSTTLSDRKRPESQISTSSNNLKIQKNNDTQNVNEKKSFEIPTVSITAALSDQEEVKSQSSSSLKKKKINSNKSKEDDQNDDLDSWYKDEDIKQMI